MEKTSAEQAKSTSPPFGGGVRVWGDLPVIGGVCRPKRYDAGNQDNYYEELKVANRMRASKNEAKGMSGESYVTAKLEEFGFGVVQNNRHDLGTDLLVFVRDKRGFDLGGLMGVQVKNWPSLVKKPSVDNGRKGWWFRESADHFDYWLGFAVPHLVVLFDEDSKESYWAHITEDAVRSTGKGKKIFIPLENVLNKESVPSLIEIALSKLPQPSWEGSILEGISEIPNEVRLRYALIAPRLIAPHPNLTVSDISSVEAIALLSLKRIGEVTARYKEVQELLDPEKSAKSDDLLWRLYSALFEWVVNEQVDSVLNFPSADTEADIAAAIEVIKATVLFEKHLPQRACKELGDALARDDYSPVDYAWLQLHLVRNLIEIGEFDQAQGLALEVSLIGQIEYKDPSARYLAGVAMDFVFQLHSRVGSMGFEAEEQNLTKAIKARDTAASWWRTQILVSGLSDFVEKTYSQWSDNDDITIWKAYDTVVLRMRSASLIAGFAADTNNWRYAVVLLARYFLVFSTDTNKLVYALNLLRIAGAKNELKLAVSHFLRFGPIEPLAQIINELSLDDSTRISLRCDFALIEKCAFILDANSVDKYALWLLREIENPSKTYAFGFYHWYVSKAIEVLANIYDACSSEVMVKIHDHLITMPGVEDDLRADAYSKLIASIVEDDIAKGKVWDSGKLAKLAARGDNDETNLKKAIERLVSTYDSEIREGLLERIKAGDIDALASWGNLADLPKSAVQGMLGNLSNQIETIIKNAYSGACIVGAIDKLSVLIKLNISHPDYANWQPCLKMLHDQCVTPNDLVPGIKVMINGYQKIPTGVANAMREPLTRLVESVVIHDPCPFASLFNADLRGPASILLGILFPEDVPMAKITQMLRGDVNLIGAAVELLAQRKEESSLLLFSALSQHKNYEVQKAVVSALVKWILEGVIPDESFALLKEVMADASVSLTSVISPIVYQYPHSDAAERILGLLEEKDYAVIHRHLEIIKTKWEKEES